MEGNQGEFDVSCMAGAAMTEQTGTVTLTTDAYEQNAPAVEVRCTIANTTVQVTSPLDFGELRVGDPTGMLEVTVTYDAPCHLLHAQRVVSELPAFEVIGAELIVLKKNGDISIKGGKIDIKGSKKMSLKGSQIAEN